MENFGKFITVVLMMIISPIISGYVIMELWGWFIVSTFEMQPLRLVEAIGIMFMINFLKLRSEKVEEDDFWKNLTTRIIFLTLASALALLSGWVVNLFM